MRVVELMQDQVKTVDPQASVAAALVTLADEHVSALPVVDGRGRLLGVVSTTDVIAGEADTEPNGRAEYLESTTVQDIMTPKALTIGPEAEVRDAARQMLYAEVHRLFVASEDRLIGVISTTDIVRAVATGKL